MDSFWNNFKYVKLQNDTEKLKKLRFSTFFPQEKPTEKHWNQDEKLLMHKWESLIENTQNSIN